MKRVLAIEIDDVLDLINCAGTYGFDDSVLMSAFAEMLNFVLEEAEIESFARKIAGLEGYTEEDYESAVETLNDFKTTYIDATR